MNAPASQPAAALRANAIRARWAAGQPALGTFVFSSDSNNVEIAGHAGFDFAIADMEHTSLGIAEVAQHLRAAQACGIAGLVRVPGPDFGLIAKLLDAGASGILLPHYGHDARAAQAFADVLRYAPRGHRPSCTGVRAARFALTPFSQYVAHADADVLGVALVEDHDVLPHLDKLFAGQRIDAVMPGPGDLSTSMGLYGQPGHPRVREAVVHVVEAARRAGLRVGMYLNEPQEVEVWAPLRPDFFVYLFDTKLLAQTYAGAVQRIRAGLGGAAGGAA